MKKAMRKKPGPAPMPPELKRSLIVCIKVSPVEKARFKAAAGRRAISTFLRDAGLDAADAAEGKSRRG